LADQGTRLSGGEAQRVRLARAFGRPWANLVILDEAFRGLDREVRHRMLRRARELWRNATLLCVTHDVKEALGFDRVWVVEEGRLVEHGAPAELMANDNSRLNRILQKIEETELSVWGDPAWRRLRMEKGAL
jgi:ATP-binding cassette subfamily B protein